MEFTDRKEKLKCIPFQSVELIFTNNFLPMDKTSVNNHNENPVFDTNISMLLTISKHLLLQNRILQRHANTP